MRKRKLNFGGSLYDLTVPNGVSAGVVVLTSWCSSSYFIMTNFHQILLFNFTLNYNNLIKRRRYNKQIELIELI